MSEDRFFYVSVMRWETENTDLFLRETNFMPDGHSNVFIFLLAASGYEVNKMTSFLLLWILECKLREVEKKMQYSWVCQITISFSVARCNSVSVDNRSILCHDFFYYLLQMQGRHDTLFNQGWLYYFLALLDISQYDKYYSYMHACTGHCQEVWKL